MNEQEKQALWRAHPLRQYAYTLEQVLQSGKVWLVEDHGQIVRLQGEGEKAYVPFWPHEAFAQDLAPRLSATARPFGMELDAFVDRFVPLLCERGMGLSLFYDGTSGGEIEDPATFAHELVRTLSRPQG